jgi:hypothetical protein
MGCVGLAGLNAHGRFSLDLVSFGQPIWSGREAGEQDPAGSLTMETSLHRALKKRYAARDEGCSEIAIEGFRIDAIDDDGRLVEIQSGALGPLRPKLRQLLPRYRMRVVKPVVLGRRLVRKARSDGPVVSIRRSPKRGSLVDVFDDLVGIVHVFPHTNLELEILAVTIDEVRVPCRRRPGYVVVDRCLGEIRGRRVVTQAQDLWELLPEHFRPQAFSTPQLAECLDRPLWFAQRVAYCLRFTGAACVVGKMGNLLLYNRAS